MKPCPLCGETIQDAARKCRFCGEFLDADADDRPAAAAGRRRRSSVAGPSCPKCGGRDLRSGPWPWYLGTIGAMMVRAVVCNNCGHHFDARKPQADLATRKRNLAIILNGIGGLGILAICGGMFLLIRSILNP